MLIVDKSALLLIKERFFVRNGRVGKIVFAYGIYYFVNFLVVRFFFYFCRNLYIDENMANIAFMHEVFPSGGCERVTMNLVACFKNTDYKVFIFTGKLQEDKLPEGFSNTEFVVLPQGMSVYDKEAYPFVRDKVREKHIDLFVFPYLHPYCMYRLYKEKCCKVAFVLHSMPFWEGVSKLENARKGRKKSFLKFLEWYLLRAWKYNSGYYLHSLKKEYRAIYDSVDFFGVLCEEYAQILAKSFEIDYKKSKFRVLTNPVFNSGMPEDWIEKKRKRILYVGRFNYADKRVDRLLDVWKKLYAEFPEWELWLVGEGNEKECLIKQAARMDRVRFFKYSKAPDIFYREAEIVCLTSSFEGWGMVLVEAQNCGCASVAFDCCAGVREILSPDMCNGILVKPFNIDEYAEKLSLIMRDESLRRRIQHNGNESLVRFSPEHTLVQWQNMMKEVLR